MERREVYYSGNVQGVGFRYTTRSISSRYRVTGQVRNLPDGRVQLVTEGTPEEVDQFLADVRRTLGQHIRDEQIVRQPASGQFEDFEITY